MQTPFENTVCQTARASSTRIPAASNLTKNINIPGKNLNAKKPIANNPISSNIKPPLTLSKEH